MLDRLEKKYGKYAIKNLIYYILGAYVIGYVLFMAKPEWYSYIVLDPAMIMRGQVWRLFTWVCSIPQALNFFVIFMFLFYFFIGKTLEQYWGTFKYNMYIFSGWFLTTLGFMLVYWISGAVSGAAGAWSLPASTYFINLTSFLAFAVIFPDTKVLFFGIIPVKMKILAWIDAGYLTLQVISGLIIAFASDPLISQALSIYGISGSSAYVTSVRYEGIANVISIVISVLNFLIFFMATAKKRAENRKRRNEFTRKMEQGRAYSRSSFSENSGRSTGNAFHDPSQGTQAENASEKKVSFGSQNSSGLVHTCSICGRTNITNPELMFRFCSKCAGTHEYCQDHLFTHEHIKN